MNGTPDLPPARLFFRAVRGTVRFNDRPVDGVISQVFVGCPEKDALRVGIWIGPDPAPDRPVREVDYRDTPADPNAIRRFFRPFRLCGAPAR